MPSLAQSMSRLGTETAFEVLARARALEAQGRDIVHLEIGEPDFDTPVNIRDAAKRALDQGYTHYGPSAGLPEFREAIAERAASLVLVHNHPSGDPTPSPDDRAVTAQLVSAGRLLDIPIQDHLVIGRGRYLSFAEAGLL